MIDPDDEQTVLSTRRAAPASESDDALDEHTVLSTRRAAPASESDDALDEGTILVRRSGAAAPAGRPITEPGAGPGQDVADHTIVVGRRAGAGGDAGAPAATGARRSPALPADVDDTVVTPRTGIASEGLATQAATGSAPPGAHGFAGETVADTTIVARGASRAHDAGATPTGDASMAAPSGVPAPTPRVASAPDVESAPYRPRAVPVARASRAEPAPRVAQAHVDTAALADDRRRRGRRRMLIAVAAASVLIFAAAVALALLLTTG